GEIVRLLGSETHHCMTRCRGVNLEEGPENLAAIFSLDALIVAGVNNLRFSVCATTSKARAPVASASSASKKISSLVSLSVEIAASHIRTVPSFPSLEAVTTL